MDWKFCWSKHSFLEIILFNTVPISYDQTQPFHRVPADVTSQLNFSSRSSPHPTPPRPTTFLRAEFWDIFQWWMHESLNLPYPHWVFRCFLQAGFRPKGKLVSAFTKKILFTTSQAERIDLISPFENIVSVNSDNHKRTQFYRSQQRTME